MILLYFLMIFIVIDHNHFCQCQKNEESELLSSLMICEVDVVGVEMFHMRSSDGNLVVEEEQREESINKHSYSGGSSFFDSDSNRDCGKDDVDVLSVLLEKKVIEYLKENNSVDDIENDNKNKEINCNWFVSIGEICVCLLGSMMFAKMVLKDLGDEKRQIEMIKMQKKEVDNHKKTILSLQQQLKESRKISDDLFVNQNQELDDFKNLEQQQVEEFKQKTDDLNNENENQKQELYNYKKDLCFVGKSKIDDIKTKVSTKSVNIDEALKIKEDKLTVNAAVSTQGIEVIPPDGDPTKEKDTTIDEEPIAGDDRIDVPLPPGFEDDEDNLPELPDRIPKSKMKIFHWDILKDEALLKSAWITKDLAIDTKKINIDEEEIEDLFKSIRNVKKKNDEKKEEAVTLLSGKRQQQLNILYKRLSQKMDKNMIINELFLMNEEMFDDTLIAVLSSCAPKPEEITALRNYKGDYNKLDNADKFVRELSTIPRFQSRMDCWIYKKKFLNFITDINSSMDIVIEGCHELTKSKMWLKLLQVILAIGNFINGKNKKKVAHGFKIKTLTKLTTMKSKKKISLLQYICNYINTNCPEVGKFINDISKVKEIDRIDVKVFPDEITKLEKKRNDLVTELEVLSPKEGDKFFLIMKEFLIICDKKLIDLRKKHDIMIFELRNVAENFGENKDTFQKDPTEFFDYLVGFCDAYETTQAKLEKERKEKERKERRKERRKEILEKRRKIKEDINSTTTKGEVSCTSAVPQQPTVPSRKNRCTL